VDVALTGVSRVAGAADALALQVPVVAPRYPDPTGLVAVVAAAVRARATPGPLHPLYLRRPDASEPGSRKRVTPV
jgi:hypothetical protein